MTCRHRQYFIVSASLISEVSGHNKHVAGPHECAEVFLKDCRTIARLGTAFWNVAAVIDVAARRSAVRCCQPGRGAYERQSIWGNSSCMRMEAVTDMRLSVRMGGDVVKPLTTL